MFRIDKSSVVYQETIKPLVVSVDKERNDEGVNFLSEYNDNENIPPSYASAPAVSYEKLLEDAQDQARLMIENAKADAENIRNKAYSEGFSKGKEDAENRVFESVRQERDSIKGIIELLEKERDKAINYLEHDIITLCLEIAEKIVKLKLSMDADAFMAIIIEGVKQFKSDESLTIYVSSDDYKRFFSDEHSTWFLGNDALRVMIKENTKLEKGDCRIDSSEGLVDIGVNTQLAAVKEAFQEVNPPANE